MYIKQRSRRMSKAKFNDISADQLPTEEAKESSRSEAPLKESTPKSRNESY